MPELFLNSLWVEAYREILNGRSVLVHAPMHYGKKFFANYLIRDEQIADLYAPVSLTVPDDRSGEISFLSLLNDIELQLSEPLTDTCMGKMEFVREVLRIIGARRILVMVHARRKNRENVSALIDAFQEILLREPKRLLSKLSLVIFDDYTLYYYENEITENCSRWDFFVRKTFRRLTSAASISTCLKNIISRDADAPLFADIIFQITGGHEGLINQVLTFLQENPGIGLAELEGKAIAYLENSPTIDLLRKSLFKKKVELLQLVLHYHDGMLTEKYDNEDIMEFHRLGIILKINSHHSAICQGLVKELVKEVWAAKKGAAVLKSAAPETRKILFVCSNPTNSNPLNFGQAYRKIREVREASRDREKYIIEIETGVVKTNLLNILLKHQPYILHIFMHLSRKDGLYFEGEAGQVLPMKPQDLAAVLEMYARICSVNLILISACNSIGHATAVKPYCNYAMGTSAVIPERASIAYAEGFYQMLFNGLAEDPGFCHDAGIMAIEQADPPFELIEGLAVHDIPKLLSKVM